METIPSEEELASEGLLPGGLKAEGRRRADKAYRVMYNKALSRSSKIEEDFKTFNGMAFLVFVAPVLALTLVFGYSHMGLAHYWVMVWVHEAGHGFWCLMGSRTLCAFMGLGNELLFTLVPAIICFRQKSMYYGGLVFLMWAGLSLQFAGVYMQSAEVPHGTSFAGAITGRINDMNEANHDWSIVFRNLGIVRHAKWIGELVESIGTVMAVSLLISTVFFLMPVYGGYKPEYISDISAPGALAACGFFILHGDGITEIALSLLAGTPAIQKINGYLQARPNKSR